MSSSESTRRGKEVAEETPEPKNIIILDDDDDDDHNTNKYHEVLPSSNAGSGFKAPASSANTGDGQNPESRVYHCKHCGGSFATSQALGGHQNAHRNLRRSPQTMESNNFACFGCSPYPYQNAYSIPPSSTIASHGSHLIRSLGVQMNSAIHTPNYNPWSLGGSQYQHGGSQYQHGGSSIDTSLTLGHSNMGQYQTMHTGNANLTLGHSNMAQYQAMHTNPQVQGLSGAGGDSLFAGNKGLLGRIEGPNPPTSRGGGNAFSPYTFGGTSNYANHDRALDLCLGNDVDADAPILMGYSPAPNHGDYHVFSNSDYAGRNASLEAHLKKLEEEENLDLTLKL